VSGRNICVYSEGTEQKQSAMKEKKPLIFIVDDSQVTQEALAADLSRTFRCEIVTFGNAEDCLLNLDQDPDIIIADYYLDSEFAYKMNGDQLLAKVKKEHPQLPVIMYSSQNSLDVVIRLLKLGAADFILKEKNFISKVRERCSRQIGYIRKKYKEGVTRKRVVLVALLAVASVVLLRYFFPQGLPYFFLGLYVIGCIWLFTDDRQSIGRES
jgi:two-component system OmpR family response regulator